jgi:hypothetical protein
MVQLTLSRRRTQDGVNKFSGVGQARELRPMPTTDIEIRRNLLSSPSMGEDKGEGEEMDYSLFFPRLRRDNLNVQTLFSLRNYAIRISQPVFVKK